MTAAMVRAVASYLLWGTKEGSRERKFPSGVQGQSRGGGLGAKLPEAGNTC